MIDRIYFGGGCIIMINIIIGTLIIFFLIIISTFTIGVFLPHIHHHQRHHNEYLFFWVTFVEMILKTMVEVSHEEAAHAYNDTYSRFVS